MMTQPCLRATKSFLSHNHTGMNDWFDVICHWTFPEIVAVRFFDEEDGGESK